MARWTKSFSELNHLARIKNDMPVSGIVSAALKDGRFIEGVIRGFNFRNSGTVGPFAAVGSIEVETIDKQVFELDMLDIEAIQPASRVFRHTSTWL